MGFSGPSLSYKLSIILKVVYLVYAGEMIALTAQE
jgi:hypothetical protein